MIVEQCSSMNNVEATSVGNRLYIEFVAYSGQTKKGFSAEFSFIKEDEILRPPSIVDPPVVDGTIYRK